MGMDVQLSPGILARPIHRLVLVSLLGVSLRAISGESPAPERYLIKYPKHDWIEGSIAVGEEYRVSRSKRAIKVGDHSAETNSHSSLLFKGSCKAVSRDTNAQTCSVDITVDRLERSLGGTTNLLLVGGPLIRAKFLTGVWFFSRADGPVSLDVQPALGALMPKDPFREQFDDPDDHIAGLDVPRAIGEEWTIEDRRCKEHLIRILKGFENLSPEEIAIQARFVGLTNIAGVKCYNLRVEARIKTPKLPKSLKWPKSAELIDQSAELTFAQDDFIPCDGVGLKKASHSRFETRMSLGDDDGRGEGCTVIERSFEISEFWRLELPPGPR